MGFIDKLLDREQILDADSPLPNLEEAQADEAAAKVKAKGKSSKGFEFGKATIDLTPDVFKQAIEVRELKKQWVFATAGAFALSSLIVSFLFVSALPLNVELESELKVNQDLETALVEYQEINRAIEQKSETMNKLNKASNNAIEWDVLISSIEGALPEGTTVSSIGITTDGSNLNRGASILVKFVADNPLGYADTLKAVQSAEGVSNVQIGGMTASGSSYSFSSTFDYDSSIRTDRFPTANAAPGGN